MEHQRDHAGQQRNPGSPTIKKYDKQQQRHAEYPSGPPALLLPPSGQCEDKRLSQVERVRSVEDTDSGVASELLLWDSDINSGKDRQPACYDDAQ
jgi:hypothetical protein